MLNETSCHVVILPAGSGFAEAHYLSTDNATELYFAFKVGDSPSRLSIFLCIAHKTFLCSTFIFLSFSLSHIRSTESFYDYRHA